MYDKIKVLLNSLSYRHAVIGGIVLLSVFCCWYIFHESNGADYQRTINAVERAQEQQRKSLELNRDIHLPLTEAQSLVMKQRQELNEAHNIINKLENELMQAKLQSMKQEVTLNEMQNSLTELKGQIENDKKTIKRLRMQRNLSQILGAGATIGVVIHR